LGQDDEDALPYLPGVVAEVCEGEHVACARLVPRILWARAEASQPVPVAGIRWRGLLMSEVEGPYRLHVYTDGAVRVRLNDTMLLDTVAGAPRWHSSEPVTLSFGWHPLRVELANPYAVQTLSLFWSGPNFYLEPLTDRHLLHDRQEWTPRQWERGRLLARALRCQACHSGATNTPLPAPSLAHLRGNIYPEWIVDWLTRESQSYIGRSATDASSANPAAPKGDSYSSVEEFHGRRMPFYKIAEPDAVALAAYLTQATPPRAEESQCVTSTPEEQASGRQLFLTLGCLACHGFQDLGESGLFGGGDLTQIGAKRPFNFFLRWLADPYQINPRHRMPVFQLTEDERRQIAHFLVQQGKPAPAREIVPSEELLQRGRLLFSELRCNACHEAPESLLRTVSPGALSGTSNWGRSCAGRPENPRQPGYGLSAADQSALEAYYRSSGDAASALVALAPLSDQLLVHNCTRCHARGTHTGLSGQAAMVVEAFPELSSVLPAMLPPTLNSVGDKFPESVLRAIIAGESPSRRDWLTVRMPRYRLSNDDLQQAVSRFVAEDRIPDGAPQLPDQPTGSFPEAIAARLVTPDGFGCTSCHSVGKRRAPNAPLHSLGPNLAMVGKRVRREWFHRWVRNPGRIAPRIEMPAIQAAVPGVLDSNLSLQLAAVWDILNRPGFQPPEPNPVRVVRRANVAELRERAVVLTDVLRTPFGQYVRPLLIALPNRHNVLFDIGEARLAQWWLGDAARQRTSGKTWFWEAGSKSLGNPASGEADVQLQYGTQRLSPARLGQYVSSFDWVEHRQGGIRWAYRLVFSYESGQQVLTVQQTITPLWNSPSGFERTIEISNIPDQASVVVRLWSGTLKASDTPSRYLLTDDGTVWLDVQSSPVTVTDDGAFLLQARDGKSTIAVRYQCSLPVDQFVPADAPNPKSASEVMAIAPGFHAVRLPFPEEVMPTGLAFDAQGRLLVTSLKGRLWRSEDDDHDGWEDRLVPISDELAAPYGVAVREGIIDVINKYALLRLIDQDGDGQIDRMETLAAGWGHTDDYHDWAVGLPDDGAGGYYVALPCQQDDRPIEATQFRGMVLHVRPAFAGESAWWPMVLEPISAGHRFPMGLARNRRGWLFATDNQGNYNPFNELNYVTKGAHFGFINAWQQKAGIVPERSDPPAINLPHPWTRSVNGICFLERPAQSANSEADFGPFEGHLLGCEYDTRRLVRMSLQQVGAIIQGAVYPLSWDRPEQGPSFLGPVSCAVSPNGHIYIGSLRDSGWGGGKNTGEIVRMVPQWNSLPCGIREVRAVADGFVIDFVKPVHPEKANQVTNYVVQSYRRIPTSAYGGPDVDRRVERVASVRLLNDGRRVYLQLGQLREGFVYEFHLKNLAQDANAPFFPAEAYFTLHAAGPPLDE